MPAIAAAIALAFAPGALGGLAMAAAGALAVALTVAGAARIHVLTRPLAGRVAILSAFYAAFMFLFPWIAIAAALVGAADAVLAKRRRDPAAPVSVFPQDTPKNDNQGEDKWK